MDEIRGRRARGQYLPRGGIATSSRSEASKTNDPRESKSSALTIEDEDEFDELTDKWIPEKPVTKAETAGYSVVIILGLGLAASAIFFASKELFMSPKEYAAFNAALKQIELDPRVTSALGESVTGYGSESRNRSQRQRIPHTIVRDPASGREVVRVQFHARGTRGNATVHAEYDPSNAEEPFRYLIADVERPRAIGPGERTETETVNHGTRNEFSRVKTVFIVKYDITVSRFLRSATICVCISTRLLILQKFFFEAAACVWRKLRAGQIFWQNSPKEQHMHLPVRRGCFPVNS